MAAITWRNVDAPNLGDPSRTLGMAQQSFTNMFGALDKELERQNANIDYNWKQGIERNTDDFMSQMRQRYTTPEEYAAAQASGEVGALREQYGAQINRTAAQELMTKMPERLQRAVLTNQAYEMSQEDYGSREIRGMALAKAINGDATGALDIANGSEIPERFRAQLLSDVQSALQQKQLFDAKIQTEKGQQELNSANVNRLNAEASKELTGKRPTVTDIKAAAQFQAEPYENALKSSVFSGPTVMDPKAQEGIVTMLGTTGTLMGATNPSAFTGHVMEELKKTGQVNAAGNIEYRIGNKKLEVPFPASLLSTAIQQDDEFFTSPGTGSTAKRILSVLKSPDFIDQAIAYHNNKLNLASINRDGSAAMGGGTPTRPEGYDDKDPSGFAKTMAEYRARQAGSKQEAQAKSEALLKDAIARRSGGFAVGTAPAAGTPINYAAGIPGALPTPYPLHVGGVSFPVKWSK